MAPAKDKTLNIRVTEPEKKLVEQAASISHMGMSQFMLQATLRAAQEVLADQTRFVLPAEEWERFLTLLDRPARVLPGLREAASRPSPFDEQ
jgi:uncharacterized protein (DUF1778 family)